MNKFNKVIGKHSLNLVPYVFLLYILFVFIFLLLRFPSEASEGVKEGLRLCLQSLIPSLYPFMVAVEFMSTSGIISKFSRLFDYISIKLFKIPYSFTVFLLSCLGGYPVGALCIENLIEKGEITKKSGEWMLMFSVNPSLGFAVSFVGATLYKSVKAGILIYLSVILSSLIVGLIQRAFIKAKAKFEILPIVEYKGNISSAFTEAVKKSAATMLYICAFTMLFSALISLVDILRLPDETKLTVKCIVEITNGINSSWNVFSLPFIAGAISFGGLSVAFQIFSTISQMKISVLKYISVRCLSAFLSYLIAAVMFKLFPVTVSTFSSGVSSCGAVTSHSIPVSVGLIVMTIVFIAEDSLSETKKT